MYCNLKQHFTVHVYHVSTGAWTVIFTLQYCPCTGLIKLSLPHFQFCRFRSPLVILFFSLFYWRLQIFFVYLLIDKQYSANVTNLSKWITLASDVYNV
jgi:hypothetical protein